MTNYTSRSPSLQNIPHDSRASAVAPGPLWTPVVSPSVADDAICNSNTHSLSNLRSGENMSGNGHPVGYSQAISQAELAASVVQDIPLSTGDSRTLESRTENLVVAARGFRKNSYQVQKAMWWKDMKMRSVIALALLVLIALTILSIVQDVRWNKMQQSRTADTSLQVVSSQTLQGGTS